MKPLLGNAKRKVQVHPQAVGYLAQMFAMDKDEVCQRVEKIAGQPVVPEDLFGSHVRLDHLACLEKIFGKGTGFFTLQRPLQPSRGSILFRKKRFNCELDYADRLLISKIEEEALCLSAFCALMDRKLARKLKRRRKTESAKETAYSVREELGIPAHPEDKSARKHLEFLIGVLADSNIVVYEHVDEKGGEDDISFSGFFFKPYTLVIKREKSLRREIFTLAHELGHYLLTAEDIDELDLLKKDVSNEEKWCNEFAFHFILGKDGVQELADIAKCQDNGLFKRIVKFAEKRHVSLRAIQHHFAKKRGAHLRVAKEIDRGIEGEQKKGGASGLVSREGNERMSEPIYSPLEKEIYLAAVNAGVAEERELIDRFKTEWVDSVVER